MFRCTSSHVSISHHSHHLSCSDITSPLHYNACAAPEICRYEYCWNPAPLIEIVLNFAVQLPTRTTKMSSSIPVLRKNSLSGDVLYARTFIFNSVEYFRGHYDIVWRGSGTVIEDDSRERFIVRRVRRDKISRDLNTTNTLPFKRLLPCWVGSSPSPCLLLMLKQRIARLPAASDSTQR